MHTQQQAFLHLAIEMGVLRFGQFQLKSGRTSPYFFNAGLLNTGSALAQLGQYYAAALVASQCNYDMLFGPAYKGIPLAVTTAIALANDYQRSVPYAFNRKEAKTHGEGGTIVGAPLAGRVLIVDDVITAGTAVREAIECIRDAGAEPAGVLIALDRGERGLGDCSAVDEVKQQHGIPVIAIAHVRDLVEWCATPAAAQYVTAEEYAAVHNYYNAQQ